MMHVNAKIHTLIIQLYGKDPVIKSHRLGHFEKIDQKIIYLLCFFTFTRPNEWPSKNVIAQGYTKTENYNQYPIQTKKSMLRRADWD